ncbi:MAG: hypothetical protein ACUVS3_07505, partial [Thermodesulfobacteriota bacterium]
PVHVDDDVWSRSTGKRRAVDTESLRNGPAQPDSLRTQLLLHDGGGQRLEIGLPDVMLGCGRFGPAQLLKSVVGAQPISELSHRPWVIAVVW